MRARLSPTSAARRRARAVALALAGAIACAGGASAAAPQGGGGATRTAAGQRPPAVAPPNDPLFRHQWQLRAIQIPAAWAISRGAGATVAVLDTGVAYENRGRYRRAPDLARTRFVPGWDFVGDDAHPNDVPPAGGRRSHGTQMAALIAQTAGNALGAAGVAPAAAIMPVRVLRPDTSGSAGDIARGLRFAVDHGADVINVSIAGRSRSPVLASAVAYAAAKGVTVVAAAGNEGSDSVGWPAADPKVIAVGAVGRDRTRAPYSNYGRALDLVAPAGAGELLDRGYGPADGMLAQTLKGGPAEFCFCFTASTSAAAAEVSAVAALLVGSRRATRPAAVRAALLAGALDLGPPGTDPVHGAGLLQAWNAVSGRRAATAAAPAPAAATAREREDAGEAERDAGFSVGLTLSLAGAVLAMLGAFALVKRRRRRHS